MTIFISNVDSIFQECGAAFSQSHNLKIHQRGHTGEKPYQCVQCEQRFGLQHYLLTHMITHTGEKPYACSKCDARFSLSTTLKHHERTHTGEKPYKCDASFTQQGNLLVHQRKHTGEKPYGCHECQARFARRKNLNDHLWRVHGIAKPKIKKIYNPDFVDDDPLNDDNEASRQESDTKKPILDDANIDSPDEHSESLMQSQNVSNTQNHVFVGLSSVIVKKVNPSASVGLGDQQIHVKMNHMWMY